MYIYYVRKMHNGLHFINFLKISNEREGKHSRFPKPRGNFTILVDDWLEEQSLNGCTHRYPQWCLIQNWLRSRDLHKLLHVYSRDSHRSQFRNWIVQYEVRSWGTGCCCDKCGIKKEKIKNWNASRNDLCDLRMKTMTDRALMACKSIHP